MGMMDDGLWQSIDNNISDLVIFCLMGGVDDMCCVRGRMTGGGYVVMDRQILLTHNIFAVGTDHHLSPEG